MKLILARTREAGEIWAKQHGFIFCDDWSKRHDRVVYYFAALYHPLDDSNAIIIEPYRIYILDGLFMITRCTLIYAGEHIPLTEKQKQILNECCR